MYPPRLNHTDRTEILTRVFTASPSRLHTVPTGFLLTCVFLHFQLHRIHLKGYSGTAGKISSLAQPGSDFSTKDADNDKCVCKCSQLTTGGKQVVLKSFSSSIQISTHAHIFKPAHCYRFSLLNVRLFLHFSCLGS